MYQTVRSRSILAMLLSTSLLHLHLSLKWKLLKKDQRTMALRQKKIKNKLKQLGLKRELLRRLLMRR